MKRRRKKKTRRIFTAVNLVLLAILLVLGLKFLIFNDGARLRTKVTVTREDAIRQPEAMEDVIHMLENDDVPLRFRSDTPKSFEGAQLVDVSIALTNKGSKPAQWLYVEVEPADEDVAVYSLTGEETTVEAKSTGEVDVKLITFSSPEEKRRIVLSYYVMGEKHFITITA